MAVYELDARTLGEMFCAGAMKLEENKDWINELNVFPVPDGDTGTNMTLTLESAVNEIKNLPDMTLSLLGKAISSGSLRGARGNSGVIVSQLVRGFVKGLKDVEILDRVSIANAFTLASETAYKAVMKPKEGTILTVARGIAEKAVELAPEDTDLTDFFSKILEHGDAVLESTPELLPVLKEAGVVDSGGQGLMVFLKGAYAVLTGELHADISAITAKKTETDTETAAVLSELQGYLVEFTVKNPAMAENAEKLLKEQLAALGKDAMAISLGTSIKAQVKTNHPGLAIEKALSCGVVSKVKLEAIEEKLPETAACETAEPADEAPEPAAVVGEKKDFGIIAVAAGAGMEEIFRSLGADGVIMGGQTMNPSAEDIVGEIKKVNADVVYVLPNNKNIILAAEMAQYLVPERTIVVIPTKTIPQGITALIAFDPSAGAEENTSNMTEALENVKTGQITYAIRDTAIDGRGIKENDIISIGDHSALLAVGSSTLSVAKDTVAALVGEDDSAICVYYGADVSDDVAEALRAELEETYSDYDAEVQSGGQPVYYYIISVE